jgi:D-alanyl-D-alanine carboxypeptidase
VIARTLEIRKRWLKRGLFNSLSVLTIFIAVLTIGLMLRAAPAEARYASLVVDGKTGVELYSRHADTRRFPASLTKIMTLYMTFDALKSGKWRLNTRLKVSRRASRQPQTRLGLKPGQTITVRQAMLALITRSANDVATVIGENLAGTELRFATKMTTRARKLGMKRTTFRNASGLPNSAQVSTARDMVKLAVAIQRDFPNYYRYFKTKQFRFKGRVFKNHNKLLGRYAGTEGIKTGYTNASGYNLVASVKRDGTHLIGVVFGGKTGARRDRHMIRLLDRGFAKLTMIAALPTPPLPMPRPSRSLASATLSDAVPRQETARLAAMAEAVSNGEIRLDGARKDIPSVIPPEFFTPADNAPIAPPTLKHWGIQVGAYSNDRPAHAVIATARAHLGPAIIHGRERVERVHRRHGTIYRARIMGLREVEARDACAILLTKHLPCVPVPADVEVASVPIEE